ADDGSGAPQEPRAQGSGAPKASSPSPKEEVALASRPAGSKAEKWRRSGLAGEPSSAAADNQERAARIISASANLDPEGQRRTPATDAELPGRVKEADPSSRSDAATPVLPAPLPQGPSYSLGAA